MSAGTPILTVKTPGRLCLLGEHQDYFGLSIIAASFNRYLTIEATLHNHPEFSLDLPNVRGHMSLPLAGETDYANQRDYLRAGRNILYRLGYRWSRGYRLRLISTIPMGKGVSSSSAMCVAWVTALAALADQPRHLNPSEAAELAFQTEVAEFGEPGGKMDHYATSVGELVHLSFRQDPPPLTHYPQESFGGLPGLVLADSLAVKDTTGVLSSIKGDVQRAVREVREQWPSFELDSADLGELLALLGTTGERHLLRLLATLEGRELTLQGKRMLDSGEMLDLAAFGNLLNLHHESIREHLGISTPAIEAIRDAALGAGALGGKIVGSGGGGCVVILAPGKESQVIEAVERAGGKAQAVLVTNGTTLEWADPPTSQDEL